MIRIFNESKGGYYRIRTSPESIARDQAYVLRKMTQLPQLKVLTDSSQRPEIIRGQLKEETLISFHLFEKIYIHKGPLTNEWPSIKTLRELSWFISSYKLQTIKFIFLSMRLTSMIWCSVENISRRNIMNNNHSSFKAGFLYGFGLSIGKFFGGLFIAALGWCVIKLRHLYNLQNFDKLVNEGTY